MQTTTFSSAKAQTQGLIARLASRFGVDSAKLLKCLTTQVFKQSDGKTPSTEELMVLLVVCENYGLNPFCREVFAFRSKSGDIVPVVSLDGWAKIVRSQKDFNGLTFSFSDTTVRIAGYAGELPEYVECSIRLKGVDDPVRIQEYMVECFNERSPVWKKWPRRMLRSRAFIQCARLAFSLTGLYDDADDFVDVVDADPVPNAGEQPTAAPALAPAAERPKLRLERPKLNEMLEKLAVFAQSHPNGWHRAQQWVNLNLEGEDHGYAMDVLRDRQQLASSEAQHAVQTDVKEPGEEAGAGYAHA